MKTRFVVWVLLVVLLVGHDAMGQSRDYRQRTRGYINPQEIVSLDSTMRMDQALLVVGELSKQFAGKVIVDVEKRRTPIGVYVVNQHWRDALEMVLRGSGLWYVEEPEYIRIVSEEAVVSAQGHAPGEVLEPPPTLDSRDVKISAVFFQTNLTKMQEYGISWNFFRSKRKEPTLNAYLATGIGLGDTTSPVPPTAASGGTKSVPSLDKGIAVISSPPEFKFANIDALVKFFGENNLGEVLTSPEVVVRNNKKGRIQVGKDIYITVRDIAGNTVNQAIPTGTIIEVTPVVYTQNDTDFVYLDLMIEQSDVAPGPTVSRNVVKTHTLLFDGEETVIGGLYTTFDQNVRDGIPFLKDLPWWFLGLRYVFGSESTIKTKTELVILLKAELLLPIRTRISQTRETQQELINKKRMEYLQEFNKK